MNLFKSITLIVTLSFPLAIFAQADKATNSGDPYVVQVNAHDYRFEMPLTMKSGWVTFDFHNKGNEMHVAILGKRPDDVDVETFKQAINNLKNVPLEGYGGPGIHSPGQHSKTAINLPPGDYVLLCGTRTAAGHSHYRLGMMHYFEVLDEPSNAPEPEADVNMTLSMYDLATDAPLRPGTNTIRVKNNTGQHADVHLVSLNGEASLADARNYLEEIKEPAPPHFMGGIEQGDPDNIHYLTVELEEGSYGWISHEAAGYGIREEFVVSNDDKAKAIDFDEIDHELTLHFSEEGIEAPNDVPAGRTLFINKTADERPHAVKIFRMHEGFTAADARDHFVGSYENWQKGKLNIYEGLERNYDDYELNLPLYQFPDSMSVELSPGTYALVCLVGFGTEEAHHKHGGLHTFTVTAE